MGNVLRVTSLVLVLLLTLAPTASMAGPGIWGFYGGLNIANLGGDIDQFGDELSTELEDEFGGTWSASRSSRTGLDLGISYAFPLSNTLGLQVEASYVSRGTQFKFEENQGLNFNSSFEVNYLEIPVLLRLSVTPDASATLVVLLGPVIGFRTGADLVLEGNGTTQSTDAGDTFTSTTFGAQVGMGLRFKVGETTALLFQARYHQGLDNILDTSEYSSKPGDIMLLAGMEFGPKP